MIKNEEKNIKADLSSDRLAYDGDDDDDFDGGGVGDDSSSSSGGGDDGGRVDNRLERGKDDQRNEIHLENTRFFY